MSGAAPRRQSPLLDTPPCTRTAEHSLCVNLTPAGGRVCDLDCLYCPFPRAEQRGPWPRPGTLEAVLRNEVRHRPDVDSITVSGPGEPSLHPRFGQALAAVLSARAVRPGLSVRVVTHAQRVLDPLVRRLIGFADERVVRIDADAGRIAGAEPPLDELRAALAELPDFCVESVFVAGEDGNTGRSQLLAWVERVASLGPARVYVTTTSREPDSPRLRRVAAGELEALADRLRARCESEVVVIP